MKGFLPSNPEMSLVMKHMEVVSVGLSFSFQLQFADSRGTHPPAPLKDFNCRKGKERLKDAKKHHSN